METKVYRDYPYQAAGRIWIVPEFRLTVLPDGEVAVSHSELMRIHRAIANYLCGREAALTSEELEFLCDVTETSFAEVARELGVHRSTLTKWRANSREVPSVLDAYIKRYFWFKLFGDELGVVKAPLDRMRDDHGFLAYIRDKAVERHLADALTPVENSA